WTVLRRAVVVDGSLRRCFGWWSGGRCRVGWRSGGWRSVGWRSGGWRSGGWRSGGWRSGEHPGAERQMREEDSKRDTRAHGSPVARSVGAPNGEALSIERAVEQARPFVQRL